MKREIKFRAWDESQKYMAYQGTADLETIQSFFHHFGDKPLMQFTGLKDRKKVEIYDGDIVKSTNNNKIFNVVWQYNSWKMAIEIDSMVEFCSIYGDTVEVIGNIYETPGSILSKP